MLLASLALLAVAVAGSLLAFTTRQWLQAARELEGLRSKELRARAWSAEQARFLQLRSSLADVAQTTSEAVQRGSRVTQASHRVIAALPFGILDAIPATSSGSRRARSLHDGIAGAVYGTLTGVGGGIAGRSRRRLSAERLAGDPPIAPGADESGPPGPSTPPADHPE